MGYACNGSFDSYSVATLRRNTFPENLSDTFCNYVQNGHATLSVFALQPCPLLFYTKHWWSFIWGTWYRVPVIPLFDVNVSVLPFKLRTRSPLVGSDLPPSPPGVRNTKVAAKSYIPACFVCCHVTLGSRYVCYRGSKPASLIYCQVVMTSAKSDRPCVFNLARVCNRARVRNRSQTRQSPKSP